MAKLKYDANLIDKGTFDAAVKVGMTTEQIINLFAVNSSILWKWIKETYNVKKPLVQLEKMRAEGELAFRVEQFKLAKKNPAVSIWVDKTWYGRSDEKKEEADVGSIEDLTPLSELLKIDEKEEQSEVQEEEVVKDGTSENIDN